MLIDNLIRICLPEECRVPENHIVNQESHCCCFSSEAEHILVLFGKSSLSVLIKKECTETASMGTRLVLSDNPKH